MHVYPYQKHVIIMLNVQDFPWYLEVVVIVAAAAAAKTGISYLLAHLHFGLIVRMHTYDIYPLNQ